MKWKFTLQNFQRGGCMTTSPIAYRRQTTAPFGPLVSGTGKATVTQYLARLTDGQRLQVAHM
jgi:hypothetical protein